MNHPTSPAKVIQLSLDKQLREAEQLHAKGVLTQAAALYRTLLANNPALSHTAYNLGLIMLEQQDYLAAEAAFRQALACEPDLFEAELNLAFSLQEQGRLSEALAAYRDLVLSHPKSIEARFNLACLRLLLGELPVGWDDYGLRFFTHDAAAQRHQELPLWDGSIYPGLKLLVHTEQGYGDSIQMARYLPLLVQSGVHVHLETSAPLVPLLSRVHGLGSCSVRGSNLPAVDAQIPLMSLPQVFKTTLDSIPPLPCIALDSAMLAQFDTLLPPSLSKRIGLCWSGRLDLPVNRKRRCPFELLQPLLSTPGISWISLQVGAPPDESATGILDLTPVLTDFQATAALIVNLDLVITIDTAVAHLAGTLNIPTWLMLPHVPDWRWLLDRDDSPWYPSIKLFRQPEPGAWQPVLKQIQQELIQRCHSDAAALTNQGAVLDAQGQHEEARACYLKALARHPDSATTHYNLGNTLWQMGQADEAIAAFLHALSHNPCLADAHHNLAVLYREQHSLQDARHHLECALRLRPDFPDALHTKGEFLLAEELFDEAQTAFKRVLALDSKRPASWNMLGITCQSAERDHEAEPCYRKAVELDTKQLHAMNNLGAVLLTLGKIDESIVVLEQLLEQAPDYHDGHWNLAGALLAKGEWKRGWAEFEYRFLKHGPVLLPPCSLPLWDGSDLDGQGILLQGEQAFGDTIQFIRFAALVAKRGGVVHVSCQHPALVPLIASAPYITSAFNQTETAPDSCVCRSPLMSLPHILGLTLEQETVNIPYLASPAERLTVWKEKIPDCTGIRVGLCWSGRQTLRNRRRSCPPDLLRAFAGLSGITLLSLQIGGSPPPPELSLLDLTDEINDFADSAALITCLDLVITIDTAVAHLAGALGKPVWLMLPDTVDWRWMAGRSDSPWYPTMRIFRQDQTVNWHGLIEHAVTELHRLSTPRPYIYQPGIDFQEPERLGDRLIPLLQSVNRTAEQVTAELADNRQDADLLVFPYYLEHLTEWTTINGMWRFIQQLPAYKERESDHLFFSDHDIAAPYHTTAWWFRTSLDAAMRDPNSISLCYQTADLSEYLHFDTDKLCYHASFIGYLGHRKQRIPLLAGFTDQPGLSLFIETNDSFHGHLSAPQQQQRRHYFLEICARSLCVICPSGEGSNSIRFFETLSLGRLPILVSNTPLPFEDTIPYHRFVLRIAPQQAHNAGQILRDWLLSMPDQELVIRCREARTTWERWFSPQSLPGRLWTELMRHYCRRNAVPAKQPEAEPVPDHSAPLAAALPLMDAGAWDKAEPLIRQATRQSPRAPESYLVQGLLAIRQGRTTDAETAFLQALQYDHRYFNAYLELGRLYASAGNDPAAVERFYEASLIRPDAREPYQEVLPCLERLGRIQEAEFCKTNLEQHAETSGVPDKELDIPQLMDAGDARREQEQWHEALQQYLQVISREAENSDALLRAGGCLILLNRHEEALPFLRKAAELMPEAPDPHVNLAICHFAAGQWQQGWKEFEWRRRYITETMPPIPELPPLEESDRLDGLSILVHTEQGFGDMLQFCRYLPLLTELGATVIFSVPRELVRLLQTLGAGIQIIPHGERLPATDCQTLLMSLPRLLWNICPKVPDTVPYLSAPAELVSLWRERLSQMSGFKVGLAWQGRNLGKSGYRRSLELEHLTILLQTPGCSFVSLHPQPLQQPHPAILDYADKIDDFSDTAAMLANLDLVISVDTAVAHLAGSLGVSCRVALLHAPDWRWFPLDGQENVWYPTLQLFRQPEPGDWQSVVQQIADSLTGDILLKQGHELGRTGQHEAAVVLFRQATQLPDSSPAAWLNLGVYLHATGQTAAGINAIKQAVARTPVWPEAWQNLGMLHQALRELPEAYSCFHRALLQRPYYPMARWNLGLLQLLLGEYGEGFRNFEARFTKPGAVASLHTGLPRWDGTSLYGKTILVHAEQGYGDTIQFVRFLPLLAEQGATVILEVQDRSLLLLCRTIPAINQVIIRGEPAPSADFQLPLLSLPRLLGSTLASIPRKIPYLSADKEKTEIWQQRLTRCNGYRIGICWKGRATPDHRRSIPLEQLQPLWELPGVDWISLQLEQDEADPAAPTILNLAADIQDFSDTAALIATLDLVISIDSAVAHLAGALGVSGIVLLPFAADWRWGLADETAPWYPLLRLIRQEQPGSWQTAITTTQELLEQFARRSKLNNGKA